MTLGEKLGLLLIAFSIFNITIYPSSHTALWIIFLIGVFILSASGKGWEKK